MLLYSCLSNLCNFNIWLYDTKFYKLYTCKGNYLHAKIVSKPFHPVYNHWLIMWLGDPRWELMSVVRKVVIGWPYPYDSWCIACTINKTCALKTISLDVMQSPQGAFWPIPLIIHQKTIQRQGISGGTGKTCPQTQSCSCYCTFI